MGNSASSASVAAGHPAKQLGGKWRATRKELWDFNLTNYGGRWQEFAEEGYSNFELDVNSEDGTFTFRYGRLCSGVGRWVVADKPNQFVGSANVKTIVDRAGGRGFHVHNRETTHVVEVLEGEVLKVTYTIVPIAAVSSTREGFTMVGEEGDHGLSITEYLARGDVDSAVPDDVDGSAPWTLVNPPDPFQAALARAC